MTLLYSGGSPILQGQNTRPPLGSFFNGQSYWIKLFPELGNPDRGVLVVKMILQFQFNSGPGGDWTGAEKTEFASKFVSSVKTVWAEKYRITTTSSVPIRAARDIGVVFSLPYYIDGWHVDDDFELAVEKVPGDHQWVVSTCGYSLGNTTLDSNDLRPETKGATMKQRDAVHEFGHMLGLRDEYPAANSNMHHTSDSDSIMNVGETVRPRHYAPFAAWLDDKFSIVGRLSRSTIEYKVDGTTNMSNALL